MKNIPEIKIIRDNLEEEVKVFSHFLYDEYYIQNRKSILRCFPDLAIKIDGLGRKKSEDIVRQFIVEFYRENELKIKKIVDESELLIKNKGSEALSELAKLMNYEWLAEITYYAIPTILPFSPFDKNKFNFSIFATIQGKQNIQNNSLFVAIHEISHFLFFDILNDVLKTEKSDDLQKDTKNYFKETLTAVLLNQKSLSDTLGLDNYEGNWEMHDLNIKNKKGDIVSFYDFVLENYRGNSFKEFILGFLKILYPLQEQFSEKWNIWKQYGREIYKDEELLKKYRMPIEIK